MDGGRKESDGENFALQKKFRSGLWTMNGI
jgi:hypothetical protein